jgi:hypothetical protein
METTSAGVSSGDETGGGDVGQVVTGGGLGGGPSGVEVVRNGGTLRPFVKGDGRAVAAGRKGAETRRAKRAAERAASEQVAGELRRLVGSFDREALGPLAAAAAADMIGRVARGEQAVRDPADWVRVLVDVARLEAGEVTSASVVAHVGREAAAAVIALRDRARAQVEVGPSSSALAADDAAPPGVDDGGEGGGER